MLVFLWSMLIQSIGCITLDELTKGYASNIRPYDGVGVLNITTQIDLITIRDIDENKFTFDSDIMNRFWWHDPRLKFPEGTPENKIEMSTPMVGMIWTPSIVILNSKKSEVHPVSRTIIYRNGNIYWSKRIRSTCSCKMNLKDYPMDVQTCPIVLEDYTFGSGDVNIEWHDVPYAFGESKLEDIPGYNVQNISATKNLRIYKVGGNEYPYDRLKLFVRVGRQYTYYIYRVYIPSILLMVFNIASYWTPDTAVPARIGLIVTTFLTNTFILQAVTEQTAKVPYTTSLQVFLMGNVVLLVLSIVEYLIVLYIRSREKGEEAKLPSSTRSEKDRRDTLSRIARHFKESKTHWIDQVARFTVLPCYAIFIAAYFLHFPNEHLHIHSPKPV